MRPNQIFQIQFKESISSAVLLIAVDDTRLLQSSDLQKPSWTLWLYIPT